MRKQLSISTLISFSVVWLLSDYGFSQVPEGMFSPSLQEVFLLQSTADRNLEELLDALGRSDNGNQNLVGLYGMLPAGTEPKSMLRSIRMDPRVRKIYEELSKMSADDAANFVSAAFRDKFSEFQVGGIGRYGMHATMFLAFKFSPREQFNSQFDEWNRWYVENSASIDTVLNVPEGVSIPLHMKRRLYHNSKAPETLMYLNLAAMDQMEKGKTVEEALQTVRKCLDGVIPVEYGILAEASDIRMQPLLPFGMEDNPDAEPLLVIPEFVAWDGLDSYNVDQRAKIIIQVRNQLDSN